MEQKPVIEFKGKNGRIELYENYVRIDRGTAMGFMIHGLKGKKDIYIKNITSIQVKKPGIFYGYIQFSFPGGIEATGGVFNAGMDENTVTFTGKDNYEKALEIKEHIEKANCSSEKSTKQKEDPLEILKIRYSKGEISKEEYEQMKKELE